MRRDSTLRAIASGLILALSLLSTATAQSEPNLAKAFGEVKQVVARASPSVVGVVATIPPQAKGADPERSVGTGVVYRADGYVITNAHVVHGASEVLLLLPGGALVKVSPADVWTDHLSDIAVMRVKGVTLKEATFADSDQVKVGQIAIAIGNPLGLRLFNSVSVGVISGMGRLLGTGYPFLQTDAAINAGNSGGPLLDGTGQVVGINTAKLSAEGIERLAFAIPANVATQIADILIREQQVVRPWLGLTMGESDLASVGLPTDEGLTVYAVAEGGPAATEIRERDEVTAIHGQNVSTLDQVAAILAPLKPGARISLTIKRSNSVRAVWVTLAQMPDEPEHGLFGDAEVAQGPWQYLTEEQAEAAAAHGREKFDRLFDSFTGKYVKNGQQVKVYLETEFMHIAYLHWAKARTYGKVSPTDHYGAMQRIRGQLEVKLGITIDQVSDPLSLTVTIAHGNKLVTGKEVINTSFYDQLIPRAERGPGRQTYTRLYRFAVGELNPMQPLLVRVRGPQGVDETFAYDLRTLR